jgi:hypothetical protein
MDAIVAVGAMAISSELRSPWILMRSRSFSQRAVSFGVTPQRLNWNSPWAARVSSKAACGPLRSASSHEAESAWK